MKTFRVLPKDGDFFDIGASRIDIDLKTGIVVFIGEDEVSTCGALSLAEVVGVFETSLIKSE